jgi:hypothetical protein
LTGCTHWHPIPKVIPVGCYGIHRAVRNGGPPDNTDE